jgi:hypothetical protein
MLNGFAIIKVCYNDNGARDSIKSVKAARFSSSDGKTIDLMGSIVSWSKSQIIAMIGDASESIKVFTAFDEDGRYTLDHEVEVYTFDGQNYLRIKNSPSLHDDLDEVPVYEAHC